MILLLFFLNTFSFASGVPAGDYKRPCYLIGDDALASQLKINTQTWTLSHTAFEEEKCQKAYLIYEVVYQTKIQGPNLDLSAVEASYTSLTETVTRALNEIAYCGFHDWTTSQKKLVTGRLCDEFQAPAAGDVTYSIFKLSSRNAKNELYLGSPVSKEDGRTPQSRLHEFESSPYVQGESSRPD
jgi:hypothetical protein